MANEKRLIDVDAFVEHWNKEYRHQYANDMFKIALANFPTVDAVEVVYGHWYWKPNGENQWTLTCSVCESQDGTSESYNYCPNCGAKMDGGTEDV